MYLTIIESIFFMQRKRDKGAKGRRSLPSQSRSILSFIKAGLITAVVLPGHWFFHDVEHALLKRSHPEISFLGPVGLWQFLSSVP